MICYSLTGKPENLTLGNDLVGRSFAEIEIEFSELYVEGPKIPNLLHYLGKLENKANRVIIRGGNTHRGKNAKKTRASR